MPVENNSSKTNNNPNNNSSPFNDLYDISSEKFKDMMIIYSNNKIISTTEILKIENETKEQTASDKWWTYRKKFLCCSCHQNRTQ